MNERIVIDAISRRNFLLWAVGNSFRGCFRVVSGPDIFLHISHDDLDGIGCTVMGKVAMIRNSTKETANNLKIRSWVNTGNINGILDVVTREIDRCKSITPCTHIIANVLITDIGSIDIGELYERIKGSVSNIITQLNVVVIDHHQNLYFGNHASLPEGTISHEHINGLGHTEFMAYYQQDNVSISYYVNTNVSATAIMEAFLIPTPTATPCTLRDNQHEFAVAVSMYDTGTFGNWLMPSVEDYDQLAPQAKLQYLREYARTKNVSKSYDWLINLLAGHIIDPDQTDEQAAFSDIELRHIIAHMAKEATVGYEKFVSRMTPYMAVMFSGGLAGPVLPDGTRLYKKNEAQVQLPRHPDLDPMTITVPAIATKVRPLNIAVIYSVTEEDAKFQYSMYAKYYLENNPGIDLMIHVRPNDYGGSDVGDYCAELRSAKDEVNCAIIAHANGGGGHPRAAGFTIKRQKR